MARFGQGVMPQLGATDYTPFMQGAIRGSESVARGIEALGAGVAQGIQQYQQNKMMTGVQLAKVEAAINQDPSVLTSAPDSVKKLFGKLQNSGTLGLKDAAQLGAYVDTVNQQRQQALQRKVTLEQLAQLEAESKGRAAQGIAFSAGAPLADRSLQGRSMYALSQGMDPARLASVLQGFAAIEPKPVKPEKLSDPAEYARLMEDAAKARGDTITPEDRAKWFAEGKRLSSASTNISMGENAYSKAVGTAAAEADAKLYDGAIRAAEESLPRLQRTRELISSGNINTGLFSELLTELDRFRATALKDPVSGKRASNTQIMDALLGSRVFNLFQQLGVGARGLDTPEERNFMLDVLTGTKKLERDTLLELTDLAIKSEENVINKFNRRLARGELKRFFDERGIKPEPITFGAAPVTPTPAMPGNVGFDFRAAAAREIERRRRLSQNP